MSYLNDTLGEVPKRLKGHPWKGCRSVTRREGSNPSFSARSSDDERNKIKKLLTSTGDYDNISELLKTTKNIDN